MPRSIQKRNLTVLPLHLCLLGKDGDPTLLFQLVGVQERILAVHPAGLTNGSA